VEIPVIFNFVCEIHDPSSNQIGFGMGFFWLLRIAVILQGVVTSGFRCQMLACCVEKKGLVFAAAFSPLSQIFAALPESVSH
jgi:hypothetical protein